MRPAEAIIEGDDIEVNADSGLIKDLTSGRRFQARPIPAFMQELIADGGLMEHIKKRGSI